MQPSTKHEGTWAPFLAALLLFNSVVDEDDFDEDESLPPSFNFAFNLSSISPTLPSFNSVQEISSVFRNYK